MNRRGCCFAASAMRVLSSIFVLGALALALPGCSDDPTVCTDRLPGAVHCVESAEGTDVVRGRLTGGDNAFLTFAGRIDRLEPEGDLHTVALTHTDASVHPEGIIDDRFCYVALNELQCVPLAGGDPSPWLGGARQAEQLPGSDRYLALFSYGAASHATAALRVVDRAGTTIGAPLVETSSGHDLSFLEIVGDTALYGVRTVTSEEPPTNELYSVPLTGGAPVKLVTLATPASYFVIDGKAIAIGYSKMLRVDLATGVVEDLGVPERWTYAKVGRSMVMVRGLDAQLLDDRLQPVKSLWTLPEGEDHLGDVAAAGSSLYLSIYRGPCTTSGKDKQSHSSCGSTKGRWQIVRVDAP